MSTFFSLMTCGLIFWIGNLIYLAKAPWQLFLWTVAVAIGGFMTGYTERKRYDIVGYYRISYKADKEGEWVHDHLEMSLDSQHEARLPALADITKEMLHSKWGVRPTTVLITQLERIE